MIGSEVLLVVGNRPHRVQAADAGTDQEAARPPACLASRARRSISSGGAVTFGR